MKRHLIFFVRLITIFLFAAIIAPLVGLLLSFILQEAFGLKDVNTFITAIATILFGFIFGYRFNDVLREYKQKKNTISSDILLNSQSVE